MWIELNNKTKQTIWTLKETKRTDEYIELDNEKKKEVVRIHVKKMVFLKMRKEFEMKRMVLVKMKMEFERMKKVFLKMLIPSCGF